MSKNLKPDICQHCSKPVGRKKRRKVAGKVYCQRCAGIVENAIEANANQDMYGDACNYPGIDFNEIGNN